MEKKTDEELYLRAIQSILNEARDEMIASKSALQSPVRKEDEVKLQALRRKLGI